ncbi:MAG: hypothetical protein V1701_09150 [Planctomycetota bacterium]|jgi:hypothetical protein
MKKLILLGLLIMVLSGCISFNTQWDPSFTDDFAHEKSHFRALWQDMAYIHKFIDRHIFNMEEGDPTRY